MKGVGEEMHHHMGFPDDLCFYMQDYTAEGSEPCLRYPAV